MLKVKNCVNYTNTGTSLLQKVTIFFLFTCSCPAMSTKYIYNRIMANSYEYWGLDKLQTSTAHRAYSSSFSWDSPGFICLKQLCSDV